MKICRAFEVIPGTLNVRDVPQGGQFVGAVTVDDCVYLCFVVNPDREVETRLFHVVGANSEVPAEVAHRKPLAVVSALCVVWFVFEER